MCDRHSSNHIPVGCHSGVVCRLCYAEYLSKNVRTQCDNCGAEICGVVCQPMIAKSLPTSIHQGKYIIACPKCINHAGSYKSDSTAKVKQ